MLAFDGRIAFAQDGEPPAKLSAPAEGKTVQLEEQRELLLIFQRSNDYPPIAELESALRKRLRERAPSGIYLHVEYLDFSLLESDAAQRETLDLLRLKYADRKIAVLMVQGRLALSFAIRQGPSLFPGAAILFTGTFRTAEAEAMAETVVAGTWDDFDWTATLAMAIRLQPATRRAIVVAGTGPPDRVVLARAREQLGAFRGPIDVEFLSGLSYEETLTRVRALPAGSVLLFGSFTADPTGRRFAGDEAAASITAAANVPAYGVMSTWIGGGIVGGRVLDFTRHGTHAADLILQILQGGRPPTVSGASGADIFDWRQLQRWNLDESRLPPGSEVRFRPRSFWASHGWQVGAGGAALLVLAGTAFAYHARAQRLTTERKLSNLEHFEDLVSKLSVIFATAPTADLEAQFDETLRLMVEQLRLDRANLVELSEAKWRVTHSWSRRGVARVPRYLEAGRYPWIEAELVAGRVVSFARPDEMPDVATIDRSTIESAATRSLTVVPVKVAGVVRAALAFSTAGRHRDWPPSLIRQFHTLADIFASALARRDLDRAARESEDRFRKVADSAPIMMWLAAADGRILYVNQPWLDFTLGTPDSELGDGWLARVHAEDRAALSESFREAVARQQPFRLEYRLRRWDGEYRWIFNSGVPRINEDGSVRGYVGCGFDMSDLKEARKTLDEYDSLRGAIFGALQGHIAALDRNGVVVAGNESWARLDGESDLGFSDAVIGANYLDLLRRAAAAGNINAGRALEAINAVRDGKIEHAQMEYVSRSASEARWFEMTVEPLRWPEGGQVVAHVDITRRVHAEEEVLRERSEIAHVQRIAMLGELTASLAHEINQPLAAIMANAQAARQMLTTARTPRGELSEAVSDIAEDARRAAHVIARLRALLRKESSVRIAIDLAACIADTVGLAIAEITRRRITLRTVGADAPEIIGDPVLLQQVLLNLLVNACDAIDAAPEGPREIAITTVVRDPDWVEVAVRDTGAGFAGDDLERMFEHFVSTKPQGLGLGLAISRSIVQAHGGRLWASRNADRGLTLHFQLPNAKRRADS